MYIMHNFAYRGELRHRKVTILGYIYSRNKGLLLQPVNTQMIRTIISR